MFIRAYLLRSSKRTSIFKNFIRYKHNETIIVLPQTSLVTESVNICGEGYTPLSPITIKASVNCEAERLSFASCGHFVTSENGCFDLSMTESIGGSYYGVDGMGLFWSMEKQNNSLSRLYINDSRTILRYNFEVYNGHLDDPNDDNPLCVTSIDRYYLKRDIKRRVIRDGGIHGTLFTPPGAGPFPALIVIYGGTKRGQLIEDTAAIFSNYGFITLGLSFYNVEGMPKNYADEAIKIEYFEKALNYLKSLHSVNKDAIGVYGISTGGSIALAMASYLPEIKCAVCANGYSTGMGSQITYGDKQIDAISWVLEEVPHISKDYFIMKFGNKIDEPNACIPVETSKADILFVVGVDDPCRTDLNANEAKTRMDAVGKTNYKIIEYPGMGHFVDPPFMPAIYAAGNPLIPKGSQLYYGGLDKSLHSMQLPKVWRDTLEFLKESLSLV